MTIPRLAIILAAGALAACSGTSSSPHERLAEGYVNVQHPGGLSQRVTLIPAVLVDGRDVEVRSVLMNTSGAPLVISARICGLDYAGALDLRHPPEVLKCAGHSAQSTLAPGDSLVSSDLMRVASPPGQYELRVRHAIAPERWASLQVVVRAP